jgi:hypothetical protein
MDCYKKYVVSLQHTGIATIWKYDGKEKLEKISSFELATHDPVNHSNVASFGVEKFDRKDPLPLLYISQCHKKPYNGLKDVLFVERINPDMKGSTLVQTIYFEDPNNLFGYALQWVVDTRNQCLYGFGNTTKDKDLEGNRHRIIKFRLPKISEGNVVFTTLSLPTAFPFELLPVKDGDSVMSLAGSASAVVHTDYYLPDGRRTTDRQRGALILRQRRADGSWNTTKRVQ